MNLRFQREAAEEHAPATECPSATTTRAKAQAAYAIAGGRGRIAAARK